MRKKTTTKGRKGKINQKNPTLIIVLKRGEDGKILCTDHRKSVGKESSREARKFT